VPVALVVAPYLNVAPEVIVFAALVTARGHALPGEVALVAAGETGRDLTPLLGLGPGPEFPLQGRDALALGVPPGPRVGALLSEAREWWLAGGAEADHAACLDHLRGLL
jgi:hypothetical protein